MSKENGIESRALDIDVVFKPDGAEATAIALEWSNNDLPGAGSPESWDMLTDQQRIKESGKGGELSTVTLTAPFDLELYKKFLKFNLDGTGGILTYTSKYTAATKSYKVGVGAIGFNSSSPESAFEFTIGFIPKEISSSSAGEATYSGTKETRALDWKVSFALDAATDAEGEELAAVEATQLEWTEMAFPGMDEPGSWNLLTNVKRYKESGRGGLYSDVQITVPYIEKNHAKYLEYNADGRQGTLTYTHKTDPSRTISFKIGFGEVGNASSAPNGGLEHTIGFVVKSCDQVTAG